MRKGPLGSNGVDIGVSLYLAVTKCSQAEITPQWSVWGYDQGFGVESVWWPGLWFYTDCMRWLVVHDPVAAIAFEANGWTVFEIQYRRGNGICKTIIKLSMPQVVSLMLVFCVSNTIAIANVHCFEFGLKMHRPNKPRVPSNLRRHGKCFIVVVVCVHSELQVH